MDTGCWITGRAVFGLQDYLVGSIFKGSEGFIVVDLMGRGDGERV